MLALEPEEAGNMLHRLADWLGRPDAIIAFSPHWMTCQSVVGANSKPATIHDFAGFDSALYDLRYPVPGAPSISSRVLEILKAAGVSNRKDPQRGLDHGVWVPLSLMWPDADIPVVPLSMPWPLDPSGAYQLGRILSPLRREGVLLMGSGSLTHNLMDFIQYADARSTEPPMPYVREFTTWFSENLEQHNLDALFAYRQLAPDAEQAHPTDEHLLPLFWAMGAAGAEYQARYWPGGIQHGTLSMDAWAFFSPS